MKVLRTVKMTFGCEAGVTRSGSLSALISAVAGGSVG